MAIFRTLNNVPEVYVELSRDFQVLCRLLDVVVNDLRFDISTISETVDTTLCNNRLLELLQSRVGFFSSAVIDDSSLRCIISAFIHIVKKKGTLIGIKEAIYTYLRTLRLKSNILIQIINSKYLWKEDALYQPYGITDIISPKTINDYEPRALLHIYDSTNEKSYTAKIDAAASYRINIGFNTTRKLDLTILKAILQYILPPGYIVSFFNYITQTQLTQAIYSDIDKSRFISVSDNINSLVSGSTLPFSNTGVPFIEFTSSDSSVLVKNSILGAIDTTFVIESTNIMNSSHCEIANMSDIQPTGGNND